MAIPEKLRVLVDKKYREHRQNVSSIREVLLKIKREEERLKAIFTTDADEQPSLQLRRELLAVIKQREKGERILRELLKDEKATG